MDKSYNEGLLKHLVCVDSKVGNTEGISKVQQTISSELVDLGFDIQNIKNPLNYDNHLTVAQKNLSSNYETVCFIGHADVVTSPEQVQFSMEGNLITGAGVGDNKGGLVVGLEAIRKYLNSYDQSINLIFVISPSEETGSIGFHDIFNTISKECDYVFGLEPALHCGSIITSRSGNRWYNIHSRGIAAHSGRFGQSHINAAHQLSNLIGELHAENNDLLGRRINVGSLNSSTNGYNTICSQAEAKLDTRFSSFYDRNYIHSIIEKKMSEVTLSCSLTDRFGLFFYSIEDDCPPMEKKQTHLVESYLKDLSQAETREVISKHSGGAADINYFSNSNAILIDGLGPVAGGLHTKNEYIERESLQTRIHSLSQLITRIGQRYLERSSYGISQSA